MADESSAPAKECPPQKKCPPPPTCLPGWLATYADMVTLLLTFFVLLLSFAKTETAKYESAMGSIRDALGGNSLEKGEVSMPGRSADNKPVMMDSDQRIMPFPIEMLTSDGLLDKQELNRNATEELNVLEKNLKDYQMENMVQVEEETDGLKVRLKDKIYFEKNSIEITQMSVAAFERLTTLLVKENWLIYVEGFSGKDEGTNEMDGLDLSAARAQAVTRALMEKGIRLERITTVFYGDSRSAIHDEGTPEPARERRVEFMIRKKDLRTPGVKVYER